MNEALTQFTDWFAGAPLRIATVIAIAIVVHFSANRAISRALILDQLGLNLGPLLTSAGVVGVALGLGAQTIVRDILSGLSMLIEDQYGVGDRVQLLDVSGVVVNVGMRITTIRDDAGVLWYLRNGEILKVGNHSQ